MVTLARPPVAWTSPDIHYQGSINFENAYLDFGFSWIVRTFCASGKRAFSCTFSDKIKCAPRVMFWLSSPHVTNIEEVSAQLLKFPSITICNVNPVLFSKVKLAGPFWPNQFDQTDLTRLIWPNRFNSSTKAQRLGPNQKSNLFSS